MGKDIRWKQRFDNYLRAMQTLGRGVELAEKRELSELEQQGERSPASPARRQRVRLARPSAMPSNSGSGWSST